MVQWTEEIDAKPNSRSVVPHRLYGISIMEIGVSSFGFLVPFIKDFIKGLRGTLKNSCIGVLENLR